MFTIVVPVRMSKRGQPELVTVKIDDPRLINVTRKAVIDRLINQLPEGIHYFEVNIPANHTVK